MASTYFVTGAAGFIGSALINRLLENNQNVIGIDNLNDYYDPFLKKSRIENINKSFSKKSSWQFIQASLEDFTTLEKIFKKNQPTIVINLAAQAGVRYSLKNPKSYIDSNLVGFSNILELCRNYEIKNFIYASSSSVYGANKKMPFSENDQVNHPISLYAATKKANELMAHTYSHLYEIPSTGLRFFTVYGPWGRPDMAPILFANAITNRKPIKVFNYGEMERDFTFIDDIVEGILRCSKRPATKHHGFDPYNPDASTSNAPHRIFNIGNGKPVKLLYFINLLEKEFGIEAIKDFQPIQPGDVQATFSSTQKLKEWINYSPETSIENGVKKFVNWYLGFYGK